SRYGLIAFASSLDQVGPMAPRVEDVARVFQVIAGHDPRDATSANAALEDCVAACQSPTGALQGLRVGQLELDVEGGVDAAVCASVDSAVAELKALGCQVSPVRLPMSWHALSVYYLIAPAEASSNLARFDGMRYGKRKPAADLASTYRESREHGFGPEVKRRIMLGTYALSAGYYDAFYLKAQKVRTLIRREFAEAFSHFDVIVGPTTPTAAFRLGEKTQDPLSMYLADLFTLPASLAGLPAMSVPCGLSPEGLPLGLQLVAPAFQEPRLFALAAAYEQRRGPLGVPRLLQA
ncbi:MAG: amidase family protein, partial [Polyangiales bacterium]